MSHRHSAYRQIVFIIALLVVIGSALVFHQSVQAAVYYVRDEFGTAAYTNNNGSVNWSANWIETNDDAVATTGDVQIVGGQLRLNNFVSTGAFESVEREVNLSTAAHAALSFNFSTAALEAGDTFVVEIYNGATWTTLETFTGNYAAARRTYDITAYRSANTRVRFRITGGYTVNDEFFYADNVEVSYTVGGTHTATSVLQTVQTYYIPVPENQVLQMLSAINAAAVNPTFVYVSLSVNANGTVIYYDHWEDGFELEVNDPHQTTTDVWGDNNPANGMPPGYTTDYLNAGDIIVLNNVVDTTGWPTPTVLKYDGGDKIASTDAIAVTRTSWASGSGTLNAGSVEMLDTSVWGTRYDVPADSAVQANDFDYAGVAVMASQNGTQVYRNGIYVTTLNEGQGYLFNDTVAVGDRITATAPIQANFLTGDIGSNYESDWFTLYPYNLLGTSYYAVVNSTATPAVTTRVFVQNPNDTAITVNWGGTPSSFTVGAHGVVARDMPTTATGMRFYTTNGSRFQAISVINSGGQNNDWGYTLIPDNQLTQQAMVGWGVGRDPTSPTNPDENGSPVWVVAVGAGSMTVCADYNGDGQGARMDNNGYHYDALWTLTNLQLAVIYDSDGDQTGMLVYLCNGSESANNKNNRLAVAWGQDPTRASTGAPGLDVGTSVPPLPNFTAIKGAELIIDLNGDTLFDVGETFEYQIEVNNVGALPIPANTIRVSDIVPTYTLYVPNSTSITDSYTGITTPIADGTAPPSLTAFPLDEGGYLIPQQLWINKTFTVRFRVKIDASLPGLTRIQNSANVSGLNLTYVPNVEILVQPPDQNSRIGDTIWWDRNGDGIQSADEPGLPGVTVELQDGNCIPNSTCLTDVTDANGKYEFPNLINNTYTVVVRTGTLPGGFAQTGDPDGVFDNRHTVVLNDLNRPYLDADFGYQGNASISNFVWNDMDGNGIQNTGEGGIGGVTVWVDLDGDGVQDATEPYAITDANGLYYIGGLPAGNYTVRTSGAPITGATATFDFDGSGTANVASVPLAAGQNRTDVDWGYRFAALSISKTSSAAGQAAPGQTITYTVIVRNNTASQQTGIAISDSLPAGTTYVAQSTLAAGYVLTPTTGYYRDQFDAQLYSNNNGSLNWTGNWQEVNDDNNVIAGNIQVLNDTGSTPPNAYALGFTRGGSGNVRSLYRQANLSSCLSATVTFDYRIASALESADVIRAEVSVNGTTYTPLWSVPTPATVFNTYTSAGSFSLNGYLGAPVYIQFTSTFNRAATGDNDEVRIDNVQISCTSQTISTLTKDNIPSGANPDLFNGTLPNLIMAGDNFSLNPGQSMTVTFSALVNNPIASGLASINNTASVISTQQITPQQASTVDYLPRANLGDRVWYDANNNGLQDGGEGGISGVTVRLYTPGFDGTIGTGDDILVATTTTNDAGNYVFSNVVPATYYVQFVQPAGYSFTTQDASADNIDSDANSTTGLTNLVTLISGSTNSDVDAGLANSQLDYGDLPSSYNRTLLGDNGPRHLIGSLRLGAGIGPDPEGQEDPAAARDTFDDGVTRGTGNWTNGATVSINLDIQGGSASVGVWIDWGGDGTFDPATDFFPFSGLAAGPNVVQITVPNNSVYAVGRSVNVRVRAFDPANLPGGSLDAGDFVGLATNGEVEDYQWNFGPTAVTLNSMSARAEAGDPMLLVTFVLMGIGATLIIMWARRHRLA